MNRLPSIEDLSMRLRVPGTGMDTRRLWVACGHKHHSGRRKGSVMWLCADCIKASHAAEATAAGSITNQP